MDQQIFINCSNLLLFIQAEVFSLSFQNQDLLTEHQSRDTISDGNATYTNYNLAIHLVASEVLHSKPRETNAAVKP